MQGWEVSDREIETVEKLLLPEGAHFADDARDVIRCWHTADVAACPGSGKTTVLLAKLKLIADRMPLENGAGICVLSHTNVAVDEIRNRLSDHAAKLLCYPNYIGTMQSFIDKFVTMPYLRKIYGRNVQPVDNRTYAQHVLSRMRTCENYRTLYCFLKNKFKNNQRVKEEVENIQALYLNEDGALCIEKKSLAGSEKDSARQYKELINDLLKNEGVMRYQDAYSYAKTALRDSSEDYKDLFSSRFQYVFIDEYQDCDSVQREVIEAIFNSEQCTVIKIGDPDQAIYSNLNEEGLTWESQEHFLSIRSSCRYSQEIADVICQLKKNDKNLVTLTGYTKVKPVLLVFDPENIDSVIPKFINVLKTHGLNDNKYVHKAIGAIKNKDAAGLKIGSYWSGFNSSTTGLNRRNYWVLLGNIVTNLSIGKLYKAERIVRKILCQLFYYAEVKDLTSGKDYTVATLKKMLDDTYRDAYRQWIYELSRIQNINIETVNNLMRPKINELRKFQDPQANDIFGCVPEYFLDKTIVVNHSDKPEPNIYVDPASGLRIAFDTIHGVKGETHDTTLYLETERSNSSDLKRILPYFGLGECGKSNLFDSSRRLAYVGMSRPKRLLCVAMQNNTYEKCKGVFTKDCWEIHHCSS